MIRDYKSFKPEDFIVDLFEELDRVDFTLDLLSSRDDFATFLQIFVKALNKHAPLRKKSRKEVKLGNKRWITKGILNSSKTKNKLLWFAVQHRNQIFVVAVFYQAPIHQICK